LTGSDLQQYTSESAQPSFVLDPPNSIIGDIVGLPDIVGDVESVIAHTPQLRGHYLFAPRAPKLCSIAIFFSSYVSFDPSALLFLLYQRSELIMIIVGGAALSARLGTR
jgi:hypothetical protein